jgi:hypothetical protein
MKSFNVIRAFIYEDFINCSSINKEGLNSELAILILDEDIGKTLG